MNPRVSVCMATYNGERYIKQQIDSILCQLGPNDELIISDDKSKDKTIEIIKSINDSRIVLLNHTPAKGSSFIKAKSNFENALSASKGQYIFMSDQDDIWHPEKIEKMIPYLDKYGCVQHGKIERFEDNRPDKVQQPLRSNHSLISGVLSMHFAGCCMGVTRDFLSDALPIPKNVVTHDGWLACYAISRKEYHYTSIPLLYHRVHCNNVSVGIKNELWFKIRYRITLLKEILKRNVK